jgi:hypothetical protein
MGFEVLSKVCFTVSVVVMLLALGFSELVHTVELKERKKQVANDENGFSELLQKHKSFFKFTPFQVILVGAFLAIIPLFYPLYYGIFFEGDLVDWERQFHAFLVSVHHTIRLFVVDADFEFIKETVLESGLNGLFARVYSGYLLCFFVVAPIMTAGVVLSFFKETSAFFKYTFYPRANIYILTELNERSIVLARDIIRQAQREKLESKERRKQWREDYKKCKKDPKLWAENKERLEKEREELYRCFRTLVVFAEVFEKAEEHNYELIVQARRLKAICFKRDVTEIGLRWLTGRVRRKLYFIGADESENVRQALVMIDKCRQVDRYDTIKTEFYVFATDKGSEALLNSAQNGNMKVRRGRGDRNLVLNTLWLRNDEVETNNGHKVKSVFETAYEENGVKKINVVIVGLGGYGTELLKTLCELAQMPGYVLNLHVFDKENGEEKIRFQAPELVKYNHAVLENDAYYNIYFHNNVNVHEYSFQEELADVPHVTSVFVTLGDDELNIETAMNVRTALERKQATKEGKKKVPIYAVVYSSLKTEIFELNNGVKTIATQDNDGDSYDITFIGDRKTRYSVEVVEQTDIENKARLKHDAWANSVKKSRGLSDEKVRELKSFFDRYEYYRRSSVSETLYEIYWSKLFPDESPETRDCYEHMRWSVHMRAEGYVGLGETGKNHLAKTHSSLVAYHKLSESEKEKDRAVASVKYD